MHIIFAAKILNAKAPGPGSTTEDSQLVRPMIKISRVLRLSDLNSMTLRERAERAHCARSCEFLALVRQEEAGLLSYEAPTDQESGFVFEIFVLPMFRRQGIGHALLAHAECHALQEGCRFVRLMPYALDQETNQDQLTAWYTSYGYSQAADDPKHMEKCLRR